MTQNLDDESDQLLNFADATKGNGVCCYVEGGDTQNFGPFQNVISGYGRIIIHSKQYGVESIREGHFNKGV